MTASTSRSGATHRVKSTNRVAATHRGQNSFPAVDLSQIPVMVQVQSATTRDELNNHTLGFGSPARYRTTDFASYIDSAVYFPPPAKIWYGSNQHQLEIPGFKVWITGHVSPPNPITHAPSQLRPAEDVITGTVTETKPLSPVPAWVIWNPEGDTGNTTPPPPEYTNQPGVFTTVQTDMAPGGLTIAGFTTFWVPDKAGLKSSNWTSIFPNVYGTMAQMQSLQTTTSAVVAFFLPVFNALRALNPTGKVGAQFTAGTNTDLSAQIYSCCQALANAGCTPDIIGILTGTSSTSTTNLINTMNLLRPNGA